MTAWVTAFLASLVAGFLSAMGLGGGGVLVLYLTLVQGFDQTKAGGVNLLFFLPAAAVALCIHLRRGQVDWRMALRCLPFGAVFALLGAWLARVLDAAWLSKGFAVLVLLMGLRELLGGLGPFRSGKDKENG